MLHRSDDVDIRRSHPGGSADLERTQLANRSALLTFAAAFAVLAALIAIGTALYGDHPTPVRVSMVIPIAAALALMAAAASARRRLRQSARERPLA